MVEDNEDDEALSLRAVKKSGVPCDVVVLRTGTAAMSAMLTESTSCPDLIILDFHLPQYNGLEILRELRRIDRFKHVPIVMFSSLESESEFSNCLREGANSVVKKPHDAAKYVEKVALMVRYWLTVHQNVPLLTAPTKPRQPESGTPPNPQVHIIKQALIRAHDQKASSKLGDGKKT